MSFKGREYTLIKVFTDPRVHSYSIVSSHLRRDTSAPIRVERRAIVAPFRLVEEGGPYAVQNRAHAQRTRAVPKRAVMRSAAESIKLADVSGDHRPTAIHSHTSCRADLATLGELTTLPLKLREARGRCSSRLHHILATDGEVVLWHAGRLLYSALINNLLRIDAPLGGHRTIRVAISSGAAGV